MDYNIKRYRKTKTGYIIDKYIFRVFFAIIMLFLLSVLATERFDFSTRIYVACFEDKPCENPFYPSLYNPMPDRYISKCIWDWCSEEYLEPGFEFGRKPGILFRFAGLITVILSIPPFIINHIKHNKDFKMIDEDVIGDEKR